MRVSLKKRNGSGKTIQLLPLALLVGIVCFPLKVLPYPGIVVESNSGKVLRHEDANQSWHPASLTKLMTLYLTFEALHSGRLTLNEKLTVSAHAAAQPATHLGLRKGEKLSVSDAIKAVATISANDAAVVLAERLQGSEFSFADEMTRRARELGMNRTLFVNASGLPDPSQKTTASDMAVLAMKLIKTFPEHFHYFSNRSIQFRGRQRYTTNGFIGSYRGADGLKTGYTCGSGYNLIATALRDNVRLIGVVLGAESGAERTARMRKLLDHGFANARDLGSVPTVDGLVFPQTAGLSFPPFRLHTERCGSFPIQSVKREGSSVKEGSIPGWGVLLGIQKGKKNALLIVEKIRSDLEQVKISSTPALLPRKFQKDDYWKILLVGLEQKMAGQACIYLLSKSVNCVIQSPGRMNSPGYSRR